MFEGTALMEATFVSLHTECSQVATSLWKSQTSAYLTSNRLNLFNSSPLGQNGRNFADDIFKCIFLNENVRISIQFALESIPKGPIDNKCSIGSGNGLSPVWRQAITWTIVDPCIRGDELKAQPTIKSDYNIINVLQNTHKTHPI